VTDSGKTAVFCLLVFVHFASQCFTLDDYLNKENIEHTKTKPWTKEKTVPRNERKKETTKTIQTMRSVSAFDLSQQLMV